MSSGGPTLIPILGGESLPSGWGRRELWGIGRLIAANAPVESGVLGVGPAGDPRLFYVGDHLGDDSRLREIISYFRSVYTRLRYVEYSDVESTCQALAENLRNRLSADLLTEAVYTGIPRGGPIILGLLSYTLDLEKSQLRDSNDGGDRPLVLVDDCALSGARFGRELNRHAGRPVVFAPLFSTPQLRKKIEAREDQVIACVSGVDLSDHAPERADYEDWKERWSQRDGDGGAWTGLADHVCFPWSEPDVALWNAETNETERGPRVVPPSRSVETRCSERIDLADSESVWVQPDAVGPIRPAPGVVYGGDETRILIGDFRTGRCLELNPTASEMWSCFVENEAPDRSLAVLRNRFDVDGERLRNDVKDFLERLVSLDLLEVRGSELAECLTS